MERTANKILSGISTFLSKDIFDFATIKEALHKRLPLDLKIEERS